MRAPHDLVLVGGGHTHVQVLRRFAMQAVPDLRLTLVVDDPVAVYSGMVPGFVAGQYPREALEIDVRPLARRAGARVIVSAAQGLDPGAARIALTDRPALSYETASFDVGSRVAGLGTPGVRQHALATRPIGRFVAEIDRVVARADAGLRVIVVGAGAGGVELAFALRTRLRDAQVELLEAGAQVLPGAARGVVARVERNARAAGIALRCHARVTAVEPSAVQLADGTSLPCDLVIWVVGAAPLPIFDESGLPLGKGGFLEVGPTLQVPGHPELFAAGDCAWMRGHALPRAGVHAVRQGPVLTANLLARVRAGGRTVRLRRHRPQRDFLTLLNLGDGRAIGAKWGLSLEGRAVLRLKDHIDRRFVRRFQVLAPDGRPRPEYPPMEPTKAMRCGGCAAKLGETELRDALADLGAIRAPDVMLGPGDADDAVALRNRDGSVQVASLDVIRAFGDDDFLVGRVAAVNAMSDLHATGAEPRYALAHVQLPDNDRGDAPERLRAVLAGARAAFDPLEVALLGGHTTLGEHLDVGFAVWGTAANEAELLRLAGLRPGDRLVLTKALGTGVVLHADMAAQAPGRWVEAALASMLRPNAAAGRIVRDLPASAVTDVSGFGFAGHLLGLLRASKVAARVELDRIPVLPGAASLLARGLRSTFHPQNSRVAASVRVASEIRGPREIRGRQGIRGRPEVDVIYDPQTSGGLLFGVASDAAERCVEVLRAGGDDAAAIVGSVLPATPEATWIELV